MNPHRSIEAVVELTLANRPVASSPIHPAWLRVTHWVNVIASTVWHHPWVIIMAIASLLLVVWTDNWLDTYYSSFWHRIRDKLRVAM